MSSRLHTTFVTAIVAAVTRDYRQLLVPVFVFTATWVGWDLLRGRPFSLEHAIVGAVTGAIVGIVAIVNTRRSERPQASASDSERQP